MRTETEAQIEGYLVNKVRALGGECYTWVSPSNRGVPDRIVLMPGGQAWFVELKTAGKKPSDLQEHTLQRLRELGFPALVLDSKAHVDGFVASLP